VFIIMGILGAGWLMPSGADILVYAKYGANNGAATTNGEWWRLLASMFMHYGIAHIAVNMWALHQAGAFFEKLQGRFIHALTYLACGVSGGFASMIWHGDQTWSAGASGAIFGVYGAILGYMLRQRGGLPQTVCKPIIKSTVTFAIFNIILGASIPGIDNAAHMGGFVCGIIFGAVLAQPLDMRLRRARQPRTLALAGVLVAMLLSGGMKFSPRFNYSITDELTWEKYENTALKKIETAGTPLNAAIARFNTNHDAKALAGWIDINLIPVYRDTISEISTPCFNPAQITAKRRELLETALRESLQNWSAFSARLAAGTTSGLSTHTQRNSRIVTDYETARDALKHERLP
jgi:rhomboid protease GluP